MGAEDMHGSAQANVGLHEPITPVLPVSPQSGVLHPLALGKQIDGPIAQITSNGEEPDTQDMFP
jgi:hypothetical protein